MIRTISFAVVAVALLFLPAVVFALEVPKGGPCDQRVKFIDYNAAEVVKLVGHYGFSTHIQFGPGELVEQIAMGDKKAWEVAPVENHIFIKPVADKATTNMTVVTTRRVYNFELSAHWSRNGAHPHPNDMFFQVNFRYPKDAAAKALAVAEARDLKERMKKDGEPVPANWNYWARGSEEVTPNRAFDDARFTYFKFSNNREMPAVYVVNPDGSESLVNTHIDRERLDTIVVHKVARQMVVRKGAAVACIFNKAYDPDGIGNPAGTTVRGVERVVKGGE
jgi:type IV secretion system protein VirB9